MPNKFALTSGAVATAIFVTALAQPVAAKTIKMVAV